MQVRKKQQAVDLLIFFDRLEREGGRGRRGGEGGKIAGEEKGLF